MNKVAVYILIFLSVSLMAQNPNKKNKKKNKIILNELLIKPENQFNDYKGSRTKLFDLLHTKIEIEPIQEKKIAIGKATLTLKPYFYNQHILYLDAKYMKINQVKIYANHALSTAKYTYDSTQIKIYLNTTYTINDTFDVIIDYVAQPYAISNQALEEHGRGMYFINPLNINPYKPFHIWTQGEVEASSFWFPTIDSPNENTSQELYVTVDTSYVTLSNGLLIKSTINDNKRTDYWKQEKVHAPYLFFLGIGKYSKYSTTWRGKAIEYYTFPKYAQDVQHIFGNTPEMLEYFSNLLDIEFPWDKYAQIVAYDYTAGAMENTSAVIFYDKLLADKTKTLDVNFDWIIAHELFHQWFGNLVTCESWANLTLNESFADYSEYLWYAYKYGKNDADAYAVESSIKYRKQLDYKNEALVNYYYKAHIDNFDAIRYEKGGRILHMLRYYVGDDAFFKSLSLYLKKFKHNSAEVSDLRKAFEEITGEDLNWFFNQWYFEKGHPKLYIEYNYDVANKTIEIKVNQTQNVKTETLFKIPTQIDIFLKDTVIRKAVTVVNKNSAFYFSLSEEPLFINFDGDGVLLCDMHTNQSINSYISQFKLSQDFLNKYRALEFLNSNMENNTVVQDFFFQALDDKDWNIRKVVLNFITNKKKLFNKDKLITALKNIIQQEEKSIIRKEALHHLATLDIKQAATMAENTIQSDSSYACIAEALMVLSKHNYPLAYSKALTFLNTNDVDLMSNVAFVLKDTTVNHLDFFKKTIWLNNYKTAGPNFDNLFFYLIKIKDTSLFKEACQFLLLVNEHEESDSNIFGAQRILSNLKANFEYKLKNNKAKATDIPTIHEKLKIVSETIPQLKYAERNFR